MLRHVKPLFRVILGSEQRNEVKGSQSRLPTRRDEDEDRLCGRVEFYVYKQENIIVLLAELNYKEVTWPIAKIF